MGATITSVMSKTKKFREDAHQAFDEMMYDNMSELPKSAVLGRDPDEPSNERLPTCPKPLWQLIQQHGGWNDPQMSRQRIKYQFDIWKEKKRPRVETGAGTPPIKVSASSPVLSSREKIKRDARAAFEAMHYNANSNLPHSQVLMRDPKKPFQANQHKCPQPLWDFFDKHGG